MNEYMDGSLVVVSAAFTDSTGTTPVNPTTVTLKVRVGVDVPTTYVYGTSVIANPEVGTFTFEIDTTGMAAFGAVVVTYEWSGIGAAQAIDASQFEVEPAPL